MLFSSIFFLYYFLPCVLLLYFLCPKGGKNVVLLLFSLVFYAWGEPKYVFLMIASILSAYFFGLLIEKNRNTPKAKLWCTLSIVISFSFLLFFKYTDFLLYNINALTGTSIPLLRLALPIGISFYTFQIVSYTVDVYRGEPAQRNLLDLATYVTMFPQLIAGPIVRYSDIARQLKSREHTASMMASGIRRFIFGLAKKILIANQLGELTQVFQSAEEKSVLFYWIYAIAAALQIYFDFSGYSDMAIGLGRIFGFDFLENFNYPYISKSVTEFWRRWHMSLGTWFRDYVYIPLGGNRVSFARHLFNILVVWMLTGFWHGAAWNFILWGLFFAILLIVEKWWLLPILKKHTVIAHIYVLLASVLSFVIFNASTVADAFSTIGRMFGAGTLPIVSPETLYYLKSFAVLLVFACVASTPIFKKIGTRLQSQTGVLAKVVTVAEPVFLLGLMFLITGYLVDGSYNPFLYFRF